VEVGSQRHAPSALPPENTRYPSLYGSLGRSAFTGVLTPKGPARN